MRNQACLEFDIPVDYTYFYSCKTLRTFHTLKIKKQSKNQKLRTNLEILASDANKLSEKSLKS